MGKTGSSTRPRNTGFLATRELSRFPDWPVACISNLLFVGVERAVDRLDRSDRRQQGRRRRAAADQISFGDVFTADASGDRGMNLRVVEIQLCRFDSGLRRFDRGVGRRDGGFRRTDSCLARFDIRLGLQVLGFPLVEFFLSGRILSLSDRVRVNTCFEPAAVGRPIAVAAPSLPPVAPWPVATAIRTGSARLGTIEFRLKWPRIDDKQQIAFVDNLPFVEVDRFQVAADASTNFDELDRFQPAGVGVPLDDLLGDGLAIVTTGGGFGDDSGPDGPQPTRKHETPHKSAEVESKRVAREFQGGEFLVGFPAVRDRIRELLQASPSSTS